MRHFLRHKLCGLLAITAIVSVASIASSISGVHAQEYVVSQRVVSDSATEGMVSGESAIEGSSVVAGCSISGDSSYVGDMSESDAGITSGGGMQRRSFGQPDLFYNYFTQGYSNQTNAQMYLSPMPIPANVGHTFYTYQPFYPHHMLYAHKDRYHRYYDNGRGMNRTRASYYYPPVKTAISNFYWNKLRLAR